MGDRLMHKLNWGKELAKQLDNEVGYQNLQKINQNIGYQFVKNQEQQNTILDYNDEYSSQSKQSEMDIEQCSIESELCPKIDQSQDIFKQKENSEDFEKFSQKSAQSIESQAQQENENLNLYADIDYNKGPEQFLKVIGHLQNEKVYKLTDLYFPVYEQNYKYYRNFLQKIQGKKQDIRRYEVLKQIWDHIKQKKDIQIDQVYKDQCKDQQSVNIKKPIQKQYNFHLVKRVKLDIDSLYENQVQQDQVYNKLQDQSFFNNLQNDLQKNIKNPYQQNIKKVQSFNGYQNNIQDDHNHSLNIKDEEFLKQTNTKKGLFGEIKEFSKQQFLQQKIFHINNTEQKIEKQEFHLKNLLYQNFTYYNQDILQFKNFYQQQQSPQVIIDLNNPQLFYEKIHGVLSQQFIKKQRLNQKKQLRLLENDSLNQQKSQNLGIKSDKDRLKQLRIQAVKQGLDPQTILYLNKKSLQDEQSQDQDDQQAKQKSLNKMIENHKKMQRQTLVNHSRIATKFIFNDFNSDHISHKNFRRFDFDSLIRKELIGQTLNIYPIRDNDKKDQILGKRKNISSLDDINELVDSYAKFSTRKRLSLIQDQFICMEYIEQHPLILQNIGMGSKLYKYLYHQKIQQKLQKKDKISNEEEIKEFKEYISQQMGQHGAIQFLDNNQKTPLLGQLGQNNIGITIIENNLFRAPVFKQKTRENDFIIGRYKSDTNEQFKYYLRKIDYVYVVGQIEPKMEIYSPNSRALSAFIKKSLKYAVKSRFDLTGSVDMRELIPLFPSINDHNLRKTIKDLGGEPVFYDNKIFNYNKDIVNSDDEQAMALDDYEMRPEDTCLYEKMIAGTTKLQEFGLKDLRTEDKINIARIKYFKKINEPYYRAIARVIQNELQISPWSASQAFIAAKQTQGRLTLNGLGDPTSGHGGYSYIKMPLKISRHDKEEKNINNDVLKVVTGTDADLRKLSMAKLHKILAQYDLEYLNKLQRWEKIDLLKQVSNANKDEKEDLNKYSRQLRVTTKMQKENYHKDVNRLFDMMIKNLSITDFNKIKSDQIKLNESPEFKEILENEEKEIQSTNKKHKDNKILLKTGQEIIDLKRK